MTSLLASRQTARAVRAATSALYRSDLSRDALTDALDLAGSASRQALVAALDASGLLRLHAVFPAFVQALQADLYPYLPFLCFVYSLNSLKPPQPVHALPIISVVMMRLER